MGFVISSSAGSPSDQQTERQNPSARRRHKGKSGQSGQPAFSVIIPLHDKAPYVARAIESVLTQTLPPHEIIVIDDASSDSGAEIVARYQDRGVTLLRREAPGPGGYAARNMGIGLASGDWIAFLDADDRWLPDHLEILADLSNKFPAAAMLATRYFHVFERGRTESPVAPALESDDSLLDFQAFLTAWLSAVHCPVWTGAIAIRRDMLGPDTLFPAERARRGGDKDLWLRIARLGPVAISPAFTCEFYRETTNKVTNRTGTTALPCLIPTARDLAEKGSPEVRRLLERLINQEISLYCRWSLGTGDRVAMQVSDLSPGASFKVKCMIIAARYLPGPALRITSGLIRFKNSLRSKPRA